MNEQANSEIAKEAIALIMSQYKETMRQLEDSRVKPLTEQQWKDIDERHRKMCTGEWDGPETPYVKYIREFYKDKDWSKEMNQFIKNDVQ